VATATGVDLSVPSLNLPGLTEFWVI
jgi:hypothetical protein